MYSILTWFCAKPHTKCSWDLPHGCVSAAVFPIAMSPRHRRTGDGWCYPVLFLQSFRPSNPPIDLSLPCLSLRTGWWSGDRESHHHHHNAQTNPLHFLHPHWRVVRERYLLLRLPRIPRERYLLLASPIVLRPILCCDIVKVLKRLVGRVWDFGNWEGSRPGLVWNFIYETLGHFSKIGFVDLDFFELATIEWSSYEMYDDDAKLMTILFLLCLPTWQFPTSNYSGWNF